MRSADERAEELTAAIYAALLGETGWQAFLDRLNGFTPGALSTLFFHDLRARAGAVAFVSGSEGRETALQDYEGYYSNRNPWMRKVAATPVGRGIIGEEIVPREEFNRSEYYSDYIRQNGLETGVGLTLHKDRGCYFLLSTLSDDRDVERNLERAHVFTRIAPHLKRVFRYYRSGEAHAAGLALGEGIGNAGRLGLIVVNDDLRVIRTSVAGERVLAGGDPVGLDAMGRVRFASPDLQAALQALLQHRHFGQATRIVDDPQTGVRLIRVGGDRAAAFFAGTTIAILVGDPQGNVRPHLQALAAAQGLSPAETRVFAGIVAGRSLTEIALASGTKRETVRTQLKSIFAKTGTASQSDIVRLATGILRAD
ncbi:helix-turn-helix transcriptional regulator [Rhizobium sp. GN54]|uniref:helix-turn-helix transcriptional regulator n=1 Tax=Rhizobium sp. GN54 TaxID=2898150 RepID=UPI001E30D2DB|nr:helix-turn-helix transcriptional regulator [Rhizobium sp. GN54]MCD2184584.1 helix-turn-helix transcriptional regulator [Rhizobium sp. GN54]